MLKSITITLIIALLFLNMATIIIHIADVIDHTETMTNPFN